jgi:protein-S-isoprenylcysteine O-methyltransferase Ste14
MDLRRALRDPWVWGQLLLLAAVGLGAPHMSRWLSVATPGPAYMRWCGAVVLLFGVALALWSARALGRSLTPGIEPLAGARLVTAGPYGHVRHPIYLGVTLLCAGYMLLWTSWIVALAVGVVVWLYFERKARAEERWLVRRYPEYREYMGRVRRRVLL